MARSNAEKRRLQAERAAKFHATSDSFVVKPIRNRETLQRAFDYASKQPKNSSNPPKSRMMEVFEAALTNAS